ncbi:MAG: glycerophosphodiester phosphodiesterase [Gemmatimonadaceae bacterium]|nr:glycerophosphodiester phosphodiesterase [Gemmatimonadaceae bacterium]
MVHPARPALIAHRGMPRQHRENTLPGFLAATAAGADGWELDVHLTRDEVVVVHHDAVLPALAGRLAGAAIRELDWDTLATAVVGAAGERVPSLDAVLLAAPEDFAVYVEVKAPGLAQPVLECLRRRPQVRAAVHCFDHRVSLQVHGLDPSVPVGVLSESYPVDIPHLLRSAAARDYWPHHTMVDAALVAAVHGAGGRVIVWTVNDTATALRLARLGVDGLCSDVVDELRAAFGG